MSSTTSAAATTAAAASMSPNNDTSTTTVSAAIRGGDRKTYWCHECDMSFSLLIIDISNLECPNCNGQFCEEMDSPLFAVNPNSSTPPSPIRVSDAYLLDRLIQHLSESDEPPSSTLALSSPASKECIDAMRTVKIDHHSADVDGMIVCAVCKDEFVIDVDAKQLPCNHIYHGECILPWLELHNSCPVCRYTLPTDEVVAVERRTVVPIGTSRIRFGNLMDEDDDEDGGEEEEEEDDMYGVGGTLRQIVRRHRLVFAARARSGTNAAAGGGGFGLGSSSSPTQMAQVGTASSANSGETVSSRAFELGSSRASSGIGSGRLVDEDGDTVMSDRRLLE